MSKLLIDDVAIFESNEGIYISRGDHALVNVKGNDVPLVLNVIRAFRENDSMDEVYYDLMQKYGIDESRYHRIVNWLLNNRILRQERPARTNTYRLTVIGSFNSAEQVTDKLLSQLDGADAHFTLQQFIDIRQPFVPTSLDADTDLVVVFSPLFEQFDRFKQINETLYKQQLRYLHVGIDESGYTLGPLVLPALKAPCLKCYAQRKIVNMADPDQYLKFTALTNVEKLTDMSLPAMRHFDLLAKHVQLVVTDYLRLGHSEFLGKSVVVDLVGSQMHTSKVLKVPTCSVCGSADNVFAPFH